MNRFHIVPVLLCAAFQTLVAQPFGPPPPDRRGAERIEQLRKVRLVEMLDLKEEQSVRFLARLNDHENSRRKIMQEKMDLLDKIERLVRNEADSKEIEALFPQVAALDMKLSGEREKFFNSLTDLLTVQQRAQFLLFERQFERELREAMKEVRRDRFRRGEE